ncbi:MAG: DMT family transporter [Hyphomicrobiales bacterium]|nr:DMT family transporter [Hyphomicrobiales bacterium]
MTGRTWALLLALSLLWGCSFPFVKVAVAGVPPMTLVFARVTIAALVLAPVAILARQSLPLNWPMWRAFFAMAFLNNVLPWSLSFWAQQFVPSSLAAILNASTPLCSVVVGHFYLADERLKANRLAGVVVGFVGVAVLIGPNALFGGGGPQLLAELALLAAAVSYAFSGVVGRRFAGFGVTALQSALGQMTAASVLIAPLALVAERPWAVAAPTFGQIEATLGLAVLSTAAAYLLFFRILARAGATNVMLVTLLVPPTAIFVGSVFLGERIEPRALAGLAFIAAGLGLIDGRLLQAARDRRSARRAAENRPAREAD